MLELAVCLTRLLVFVSAKRLAREGKPTLTDTYSCSHCYGGVRRSGYGALVSVLSGDWVAATLSLLSAAAMVGGICFRNFGAPRRLNGMLKPHDIQHTDRKSL